MIKIVIQQKYSCLFFTEGKNERSFLYNLKDHRNFCHYAVNWQITINNASGGTARVILETCLRLISGISYDLVICFIDLDRLKKESGKNWLKDKLKLEEEFSQFKIVWQEDNLEDECEKVLKIKCDKFKINQLAKKSIDKFVNSDYWNKIKKLIVAKEKDLGKKIKQR